MLSNSEQEKHYKSVFSFLKYGLTVTGALLTIIASVGIYFTYNSITDMKNDSKQLINESRESIKEIMLTNKNILDDTRNNANSAINYIKNDAKDLAITTSRNEVEKAFEETNIKSVIDEVAHSEIEGRIKTIVDQQIAIMNDNFTENQKLTPVFILAVDKIRFGNKEGLTTLDSIYYNSKDIITKRTAYKLMMEKGQSYDNDYGRNDNYYAIYGRGKDTSEFGKKSLILSLKNDILSPTIDLETLLQKTRWLSILLKKDFKIFDLQAIRDIK